MSDSILREKAQNFAKESVFLCRKLKDTNLEQAIVNQLLRSATSVGANVYEAQYAQGTKDFISKFEIALKECNETSYWLTLIYDIGNISEEDYKAFTGKCIDIRRMLVSSVKTLKQK